MKKKQMSFLCDPVNRLYVEFPEYPFGVAVCCEFVASIIGGCPEEISICASSRKMKGSTRCEILERSEEPGYFAIKVEDSHLSADLDLFELPPIHRKLLSTPEDGHIRYFRIEEIKEPEEIEE